VVRFYNKRRTAEQWIKEGKQAVKMTRLSCHRFCSNEVRLRLSLIAYNLGNLWQGVPSGPGAAAARGQLVADQPATAIGKDGGRLIKHTRYYWLLLAESHLTRRLFRGYGLAGPRGRPGVASAGRIGGRSGGSNRSKQGRGSERCVRNRLE